MDEPNGMSIVPSYTTLRVNSVLETIMSTNRTMVETVPIGCPHGLSDHEMSLRTCVSRVRPVLGKVRFLKLLFI